MNRTLERHDVLELLRTIPGGEQLIVDVFDAIDRFQRSGFPAPAEMSGLDAREMAGRVELISRALDVVFGCPLKRRVLTLQQLGHLFLAEPTRKLGTAATQCFALAFRREVQPQEKDRP